MKKSLLLLSLLFMVSNSASAKSFEEFCNGTIGVDITAEEADTVAMLKLAMLPKAPWPFALTTKRVYGENGEVIRPAKALRYNGYAVPKKSKFERKFNSKSEIASYLRNNVFAKKSNCKRMNEKFLKMESLQLTTGKFFSKGGDLISYPLKTITPIEEATNLKFVILNQNELTDVSSLKNLLKLEAVQMAKNKIKSIDFVKSLPSLTVLDAAQNAILDLSPLIGAIQLEELTLTSQSGTKRLGLIDISPLKGLSNLFYLMLGNNSIKDITPLKGLTSLNVLSLSNNDLVGINEIKDLVSLRSLYVKRNHIAEIDVIRRFSNIQTLSASDNNITDCSALKSLSGIKKLTFRRNPCN